VVTVWECEVQDDAAGAARRIAALVNGLRY
jgi:G:T-mismatch repair DNA endonuclease (very short patch repair protein)